MWDHVSADRSECLWTVICPLAERPWLTSDGIHERLPKRRMYCLNMLQKALHLLGQLFFSRAKIFALCLDSLDYTAARTHRPAQTGSKETMAFLDIYMDYAILVTHGVVIEWVKPTAQGVQREPGDTIWTTATASAQHFIAPGERGLHMVRLIGFLCDPKLTWPSAPSSPTNLVPRATKSLVRPSQPETYDEKKAISAKKSSLTGVISRIVCAKFSNYLPFRGWMESWRRAKAKAEKAWIFVIPGQQAFTITTDSGVWSNVYD